MVPILEEEESRREFNIHEYGDEVLGKFQQIGQTIPYVEVRRSIFLLSAGTA